jgi:hypothetical protein
MREQKQCPICTGKTYYIYTELYAICVVCSVCREVERIPKTENIYLGVD